MVGGTSRGTLLGLSFCPGLSDLDDGGDLVGTGRDPKLDQLVLHDPVPGLQRHAGGVEGQKDVLLGSRDVLLDVLVGADDVTGAARTPGVSLAVRVAGQVESVR